jgi:hypothetical protein
MSVFADASKRNIHGGGAQGLTDAADYFNGVTVAIQKVMLRYPRFGNQVLEKIFAKAGSVSDGQPDVFIEVKHLDLLPVDVLRAGQSIKKIELGRPGCDDDAGASAIEDRPADRGGRLLGGGLAEGEFIFKYSYEHAVISCA